LTQPNGKREIERGKKLEALGGGNISSNVTKWKFKNEIALNMLWPNLIALLSC